MVGGDFVKAVGAGRGLGRVWLESGVGEGGGGGYVWVLGLCMRRSCMTRD